MGLFLSLNLASAALAWVSPTASTNHSSAVSLRVSFTNGTDVNDPLAANSSLWYSINSGTSWTEATVTSEAFEMTAGALSNWTGTLAIDVITDNADVDFNLTLNNVSGVQAEVVITGLTIDDTVSTCTSGQDLTAKKNLVTPSTNILTCACTDAIDSAPTITRTLTQPGASTVTVTTSPYTTTRSDLAKIGTYTFSCSAIDYTGVNSSTNTRTFTVNSDDDSSVGISAGTTIAGLNKRTVLVSGIVIVIVLIAGAGVFFALRNN